MDTTFLRQLLQNLCHDFKWDYAVFWKLHHQIPIFLSWEDGYCNHPSTGEFVEGVSDNAFMDETASNFPHEIDVINVYSAGSEVALAMEKMRDLQYSPGEGHIGMVASTGKNCWLSSDELYPALDPELPEDLCFQFALGFKTIFVVPVNPLGVVQLGSLRKANEDPALVTHIKDMFHALQRNLEESLPSSLNRCLSSPPPSVTSSLLQKRILTSRDEMLKPIQSYVEGGNPVTVDDAQVTMLEESKYIPETKFQFVGQCHHQAQDHTTLTEFGYKPLDFSPASFLENRFSDQFLNGNILTKLEPISPNPFYSEENQLVFSSHCGSPDRRVPDYTSLGMDFNPFDYMMDQQFLETGEVIDQISSHELLDFPADWELHKALAATSENRGNEDACSTPTLIHNTDFFRGIEQFFEESQGLFMTGKDADNLLDAVISNMYDAPGNISSSRSNSTTSPTISSGHLSGSCQTQTQSKGIVPIENVPDLLNSLKTETGNGNAPTITPSKFPPKNTSDLIDKEKKEAKHIQSKKSSTKLSQIGQKRPRQSDAQKQRPRDRQMIQDRVKELRELVPNGGKCSIDALLDQTIKHMLYLRSISNRAENLKQCAYTKSPEKQGASWAVEMDNTNLQVCPIVVKDLDQPGLMLIEMLCEENGLFLEIAQVIRRLDLTILKGSMENRMDKSWAHFIVEASSGFRRLDIFWPLMKLLQRNSSISNII